MKHILVLGDVMVDIHHHTTSTRMCPEASHLPVLRIAHTHPLLGGASNVAKNLLQLGHHVHLVSVIGGNHSNSLGNHSNSLGNHSNSLGNHSNSLGNHSNSLGNHSDPMGDALQGEMVKQGFPPECVHLFVDTSRKTTQKYRFFRDDKLLLRYDVEDVHPLSQDMESIIWLQIETLLPSLDALVLSDYNKGCLTETLCQRIIHACRERGIFTFVDPKPSHFMKYKDCFCFKPNLSEAYTMTGLDNVQSVLNSLQEGLNCDVVLLTCGDKGLHLQSASGKGLHLQSASGKGLHLQSASGKGLYLQSASGKGLHLQSDSDKSSTLSVRPLQEVHVVDATGCGDTVLAVFVDQCLKHRSWKECAEVANYVAGKCVQRVGNYVASQDDVEEAKVALYGLVQEVSAHWVRTLVPCGSKRLVFTNGCFDLVHSAHLRLLQFAKSLGDVLVVAVNSDASVRRFKGQTRPIQSCEERCRLLLCLDWVDYVVVMESDTPLSICEMLRPDVLVKGGDYKVDQVVGREWACQVVLYDYHEGLSTTNTVAKIMGKTI
jgi:D-beta-D-heptose 7-phosphate kinase/D-beta-D-heptose 1-phosphate adenosyltransferase